VARVCHQRHLSDGEKSINFEAAPVSPGSGDSLQTLVGKTIDLAGVTTQGQKLDMSRFKGKVSAGRFLGDVVRNHVGPKSPTFAANWDKYHDQGFEVIAISVDETMQALAAFIAEEKPPWTIVARQLSRQSHSMGGKFGIRSIPAFILIGETVKVAAINCRGPQLEQSSASFSRAKRSVRQLFFIIDGIYFSVASVGNGPQPVPINN